MPNTADSKIENPISVAGLKEMTTELMQSANDLYLISIPLMASAELGDEKLFQAIYLKMSNYSDMDMKSYPQGLQNKSFKAWMLGRMLLAANTMKDNVKVENIRKELTSFLKDPEAKTANSVFISWARGYLAALNKSEYKLSRIDLRNDIQDLIRDQKGKDEILWTLIMFLSAAAKANNFEDYEWIKNKIKILTNTASISEAVKIIPSSDYPAWALAKISLAAALMNDKQLYDETNAPLESALGTARQTKDSAKNSKAEYVLATLDHQQAIQTIKLKVIPKVVAIGAGIGWCIGGIAGFAVGGLIGLVIKPLLDQVKFVCPRLNY